MVCISCARPMGTLFGTVCFFITIDYSFTIGCGVANIYVSIDGCGCAVGNIDGCGCASSKINIFIVTELTGFPWSISSDVIDIVGCQSRVMVTSLPTSLVITPSFELFTDVSST